MLMGIYDVRETKDMFLSIIQLREEALSTQGLIMQLCAVGRVAAATCYQLPCPIYSSGLRFFTCILKTWD